MVSTILFGIVETVFAPVLTAADKEALSVQTERSGISDEVTLSIDPAARSLVLERLVPTKKITDIPLLRAVMHVPRDLFVPKEFREDAYTDLPIPLGSGRTLASPFETVYALQKLNLYPSDQVLIIGPGVGYPAAIAAQLADRVTAFETLSSLQKRTNDAVKQLGFKNIRIKGISPEQAEKETGTFDKIFVLGSLPEDGLTQLTDRLNEGGILAAPIGTAETQQLVIFTKTGGELSRESSIGLCPTLPLASSERGSAPEKQDSFLEESFEFTGTDIDLSIPGWFDLRNVSLRSDPANPGGGQVLWFDSVSVRTEQKRKDALRRKELAAEKDLSEDSVEIPDLELPSLTLRQREEERVTLAIRVFRLNGKNTRRISFFCRMEGIGLVPEKKSRRSIITSSLVFFDENRYPLKEIPLISFRTGDTAWKEYRVSPITVPKKTKEAELRLGLSDGYGILKIDELVIKRTDSSEEF